VIHNVRDLKEGNSELLRNKKTLENFIAMSQGLLDGDCRILNKNGQLQEVVKIEAGGKFGRDVTEVPAIIRTQNNSQSNKIKAVCKDGATGEIYLIDRDDRFIASTTLMQLFRKSRPLKKEARFC